MANHMKYMHGAEGDGKVDQKFPCDQALHRF